MSKKIKFKFKELDFDNKILVYTDYIDREFFNRDYDENWEYNGIKFHIMSYTSVNRGDLTIKYTENEKIKSFIFYIGIEENYFIINKNEVKLFKDLENIVYDDKKSLSYYLIDNKYYYIYLDSKLLEYDVDDYIFDKDYVDEYYFLSGNMFKTKKEAKKIVKKLNNEEITIKDIKEERQKFFKNYSFN